MNIYLCLEKDKKVYKNIYKNCYQIDLDNLMVKSNYIKIKNMLTRVLLNQSINIEVNKFIKSKKYLDLLLLQHSVIDIDKLYSYLSNKFENFTLILLDPNGEYEHLYNLMDSVI